MKNLYVTLLLVTFSIGINAQDLAKKIPSTAKVVVTIKGKNVLELMSLPEFSNSKLGKNIGEEISKNTREKINSIEKLGLNLNENFYYFLDAKENVLYHTFMIPFANGSNIPLLFEDNYNEVIKDGNLSYINNSYEGNVTIWDNNTLMIIIPGDEIETDYDYGYNDVEETIAVEKDEVVEEAYEETEIEETVIESTEDEIEDSRRKERRIAYEEKRARRLNNSLEYAKQLFTVKPAISILQNPKYKKAISKGNYEMLVWVDDFLDIYEGSFPSGLLGYVSYYEYLNIDELYQDMSLTGKLNFKEDEAILSVDYIMNEKLAEIYKPIYDGKFNKSFLNYINQDKLLGYLNVNLSTEGALRAYPELHRKMFNREAKGRRSEQTTAAVTRMASQLFSLLIDEEGAAKIIRGDMLLLLTDLREREVTYTDYEYDEDYNYKKVEKTKTESIPDFLLLFTSEEERIFNGLMNFGVLEKEISYNDGIYLLEDLGSFPLEVYMLFKDNTVFIGSSLNDLTQIKNGTYQSKVSSQFKKDLSKNATSFYVNGKSIISKIPSDAFPRGVRDNIEYLTDNTENLRVNFSKMKGNTLSGKMILETPKEGHKNSFVYFINILNQLID